jgi:hypothetical protein
VSEICFACDNTTVRGAAFYDTRDIHRLAVMANRDDPEGARIEKHLREWLEREGKDLNLEVVRVNADDPQVPWQEYGIPSAPPTVPVVVLSGTSRTERKFFLIDHWEPEPTEADLQALASSPVREALRTELGKRVVVLLHIPASSAPSPDVEKVLAGVAQSDAAKPLGVAVLTMNRGDPNERVLASFVGGKEGEECVAAVFGPGRLMPPLVGREISEAQIGQLMDLVKAKCTCLRPPSSYGVDIPMSWTKELSDAALALPTALDERVAAASRPTLSRRIMGPTLWTLGALLVLVAASAGALFWLRRDMAF